MRTKLNVSEQIAVLKRHGVTFNLYSESDATTFLESCTYFFKLKAFENNFDKDGDQYIGLDFAYLVDLSTIDLHLRALLRSLCLDIEHAMKVRFNNLIMNDPNEDGHEIVHAFDSDGKYQFNGDYKSSEVYHYSTYSDGMIRKYCTDPAIWNLWEVVSFKILCDLYEYYLKRAKLKDNVTLFNKSVRSLRNASSHNNCLLIGIEERIKTTEYLKNCLKSLFHLTNHTDEELHAIYGIMRKNPLVHDYACVLMSFLILSDSKGMRKSVAKEIDCLIERMERSYQYSQMKHCPVLSATFRAMKLVSESTVQYINKYSEDFSKNKILHTKPQPNKMQNPMMAVARVSGVLDGHVAA